MYQNSVIEDERISRAERALVGAKACSRIFTEGMSVYATVVFVASVVFLLIGHAKTYPHGGAKPWLFASGISFFLTGFFWAKASAYRRILQALGEKPNKTALTFSFLSLGIGVVILYSLAF